MPAQSRPPRIVEVVRGLGLGGAETLLFQRLKYAIENKTIAPADTMIFNTYPTQSYFADKIRSLGVVVQNSRSDARLLSSFALWRFVEGMNQDQMVVIHSPFPAAVIKARTALRHLPFPVIEVSHNTQYAKPTVLLGRVLNQHVDLCIAVSDDVAAAETTHGFPRKTVILAGTDRASMRRWVEGASQTTEGMRTSIGVIGDSRLIVAVGSLAERKGHRLLISALAELADRRVHVAIIGAGEQRPALERQIASLGLDSQAHLLGQQDDAWRWTAAADVLAHPSYHEGLPVVLIEARVLGVPIVASDVGGARQVLAGSPDSVLIEPDEISQLAAALKNVLTKVGSFADVFPSRATEKTFWDMSRYSSEFYEAIAAQGVKAPR